MQATRVELMYRTKLGKAYKGTRILVFRSDAFPSRLEFIYWHVFTVVLHHWAYNWIRFYFVALRNILFLFLEVEQEKTFSNLLFKGNCEGEMWVIFYIPDYSEQVIYMFLAKIYKIVTKSVRVITRVKLVISTVK